MLNHLLHREFDFATNIVGAGTVGIPQLDAKLLIRFDEFRSNQESADSQRSDPSIL